MKGKQIFLQNHNLSSWLCANQSTRKFLLLILLVLGVGGVFIPNSTAQQNPIAIGSLVKISTNGARLNLRESPTTEANVIAALDNGTILTVIGGPEFANDFEWWQLQGETATGWAASQFLTPLSNNEQGDTARPGPSEPNNNLEELVVPPTPMPEANTSFDPEENNISSTEAVAPRNSDAYGFSKICFLNWKVPSWDDILPFEFDSVRTINSVEYASSLLSKIGFSGSVHENVSANVAIDHLENDTVFFFFGHGANKGLVFHDDNCNYTSLQKADLQAKPILNKSLDLAVLLGCETGSNLSDKDNIMMAFRDVGATKVIGFNHTVWEIGAEHWNKKFWQYAVEDEMEVGAAARKAVLDEIWGAYWIPPAHLVVVGTEDVFLHEQPNETPSLPPGTIPKLPDLDALLDQWSEKLQAWWQGILASLEEFVTNLIGQTWDALIAEIGRAIKQFFNQLCSTSFGLILLAGGIRFGFMRKKHNTSAANEEDMP